MAFQEPRQCPRCRLPHVTTILSILNKPALVPWAVREERRKFKEAMLEVLTQPGTAATPPELIWSAVEQAVTGLSEAERLAKEAADIGTAAHALIARHLLARLGRGRPVDPVLEQVPEAVSRAVQGFLAWAESVDFEPRELECHVQSEDYGYAGVCDCVALVQGVPTLLDFKSSKRVYPEAFLQVRAYQEAARAQGLDTTQGLIVRLPKVADDPGVEAVVVPEDCTTEDFLHCLGAYRWQRRMAETAPAPA